MHKQHMYQLAEEYSSHVAGKMVKQVNESPYKCHIWDKVYSICKSSSMITIPVNRTINRTNWDNFTISAAFRWWEEWAIMAFNKRGTTLHQNRSSYRWAVCRWGGRGKSEVFRRHYCRQNIYLIVHCFGVRGIDSNSWNWYHCCLHQLYSYAV